MEAIYSYWSAFSRQYIVYRDGMLLHGGYQSPEAVWKDYPQAIVV